MNENVANVVRDTIVRMTTEANEKRKISDAPLERAITTRTTIDRDDALRAVILVEPVQGSQHTYSVEVKKC